ncbi:preprotein translocase subunit TatA [Sorangium cellulosum]|uniref:Preprotein translocase subunit TatA n=1 Tax=Sorangium cellulosum TaxID=56 RepID=A0A150NYJ8_SORCE|nr:preprotein translocase subunit TatA [Sorangium cellulosum]
MRLRRARGVRVACRAIMCAVLCTMSHVASAQSNDPKVRAQELFEQGRAAVEARDCVHAIPLFRRSQATYPSRGALLNLAQCEADIGRVASAWQHFRELLGQLTPGDSRFPITQQRIAELEPRVPKLVVEVAEGVPVAELLLDQAPLPQASIGGELPVDPGNHTVVARWSDGRQTDVRVFIAERARKVVRLEPPPATGAPPPPATAVSTTPQLASPPPHDASGSPSSVRRSLAFAIGGVGAAALGGSLITGGLALGTKGELEEECPTPSQCTEHGISLSSRGQTLTTTSTVLGAIGLAGIGAGLVLLLTTPEQGTSVALAPAVLPGGGGALLRSRF